MHFEFLTTCHQSAICHKKATIHIFFSSTETHVRMTSFILTIENVGMPI